MFGAIGGDAESVTEPDNVEVNFSFSPDDWRDRPASEGWEESGTITVRIEEPYSQWETGPSLVSMFQLPDDIDPTSVDIQEFDIDDAGNSVRGTARFVDPIAGMMGGDIVAVDGTFEFTCPD